jgi:acyl-CoA thioesterase-1
VPALLTNPIVPIKISLSVIKRTTHMSSMRAAALGMCLGLAILCVQALASTEANCQTIVALGASNTEGKGVGNSQAFPAQLEAMLHAKGYPNARVINAGISGDTPTGMLQRLGSVVPQGTKLVILQPGGNDLRGCRGKRGGECATRAEHGAVIGQIRAQLRSRGIPVVMAKLGGLSDEARQSDRRHLTPEAHRAFAAQLLPQVVSALGKRGA